MGVPLVSETTMLDQIGIVSLRRDYLGRTNGGRADRRNNAVFSEHNAC